MNAKDVTLTDAMPEKKEGWSAKARKKKKERG